MKSVLKFFLTSLGMVLILTGVASILILTQVERYFSRTIEEVLEETFATAASIDSISLDPGKRSLLVHDFALANPKGFKDGPALESKIVRVRFDLPSLITDEPIVELISFEGTDVYYRYEFAQGSNLKKTANILTQQLEQNTVSDRRFIVEALRCEGARVHFSTNLIPKASANLNVVNLELTDLHQAEPLTTADLTSIFLRSLLTEIVTIKGLLSPVVRALKGDIDEMEAGETKAVEMNEVEPPPDE